MGAFAEGTIRGEEGVRIAEAIDHPFSLIWASAGIGKLYLNKGDFHRSILWLERGLGLCQAWDIPSLFPTVAGNGHRVCPVRASCRGSAVAGAGGLERQKGCPGTVVRSSERSISANRLRRKRLNMLSVPLTSPRIISNVDTKHMPAPAR